MRMLAFRTRDGSAWAGHGDRAIPELRLFIFWGGVNNIFFSANAFDCIGCGATINDPHGKWKFLYYFLVLSDDARCWPEKCVLELGTPAEPTLPTWSGNRSANIRVVSTRSPIDLPRIGR